VDTTLVLAAPKIGPIAGELRERVAELLSVKASDVGIKAKTPEGLNTDHVAQAHAVVLLESVETPAELRRMSADIENQQQLEDVVKDLVNQVPGIPLKSPFDTEDIT
jgi:2-C-methyl-D-erythritol 2,4-cyclodiphosphate synthase